ncbi:hypothetical protein Cgig2_011923 [Carnegiea gigantea]|uniref:Glycosyltransferase n=1 Tax=Carnegiea gigantea TaxID=171969 RepID=A0A9Q1K459_9CARY|nr:hypothetical protein Cgig2_011923 [Carnegiea gigantea]
MADDATASLYVAAIPFPGRGHVNPLLNLCKIMAQKKPDIHIAFIVTEEWLGLLHGSPSNEPLAPTIIFATIPNVLPSEKGRGADMDGFIDAVLTKMAQPVEQLLDRFDLPVQLIVADTFLSWAVEVGNLRNVPVASFWPASASMLSMFVHYDLIVDNLAQLGINHKQCLENIPGISSISIADLPDGFSIESKSKMSKILYMISMLKNTRCLLFRTIEELEEHAISALKPKLSVPMYTIGPCIPSLTLDNITTNQPSYIAWLSSQPQKSVLYVSLGSVISISSHQMDELAAGLRNSGVRFLLVSRGEALKFQGGCGEKGMVVPWCDQSNVLGHGSVGGFLTHCGWNSVIESIFTGVPMITFPLLIDQKPNSKLVVEDWGVGWRGKSKAEVFLRGSVVGRDRIAQLVKMFMDLESEERKNLEGRCTEVREMVRATIGRGGSAQVGFDAFLANISDI